MKKKIFLGLAVLPLFFLGLLAYNIITHKLADGPPLPEQVAEAFQVTGRLLAPDGDRLLLQDDQGREWELARDIVESDPNGYEPEPGCTVQADGERVFGQERLLSARIIAPPPDLAQALELVAGLSLEEKVGQMFLARCPADGAEQALADWGLAGYILFDRDIAGETPQSLREKLSSYQAAAAIPLLIGVDEEGGTVVRVSNHTAFRASRFPSPQSLYGQGGLELVLATEREKARLLSDLGFNLNFAPVADVSTSAADFIHDRSLGQGAEDTAVYVAAVVEELQAQGVGAVLKHFPGYGDNGDTHGAVITDPRGAETFRSSDFLPFSAGITAGAGMVLMSHNITPAFDPYYPASLSPALHQLLRQELGFRGLIITDDLVMAGVNDIYGSGETAVLAVLAGNDLLLSSDHETQITAVLQAIAAGRVPESLVDAAATRVLRYKLNIGLL